MNSITRLSQSFYAFLTTTFGIDRAGLSSVEFQFNSDERKQQFGDISTNAALILGAALQRQPREIAQQIIDSFKHADIKSMQLAGPGFVNFVLTEHALQTLGQELFAGQQFFKPNAYPAEQVSLEFVSANPTGPLHLGHGRGGIIGDVLGNVLAFLGDTAVKEFYVNDAGAQIERLGCSFQTRCLQLLGDTLTMPEDGYHGEYLIELARPCVAAFGNALRDKPLAFFSEYAKDHMLEQIKATLKEYGIVFDVWFSERLLHESGAIKQSLAVLTERGYTYTTDDGALWFKSTEFGDDKDRVLIKSNGQLTYAAADVAYLRNKRERGFKKLFIVVGQDHHSYGQRLKGFMQALGYNPDDLTVILYQLVTIKESGVALRMSKRAGRIVTLEDVIAAVGKDVARFFYLNKKADAHLEFDIELALKQSQENPVYYIQYAYVRTRSLLEKASQEHAFADIDLQDAHGLGREEALLLKKIASLQSLLLTIGRTQQTHLLTYYILELAQLFHKYYSAHRIIDSENSAQSRARLYVVTLINTTIKFCLDLLGISAPTHM